MEFDQDSCWDPNNWESPLPYQVLYLSERDLDRCVLLDRVDYIWAIQWQWTWSKNKWGKPYVVRTIGTPRNGSRSIIRLHVQVLMRYAVPASSLHIIGDHVDGNSLDCRRDNLRWATLQQNNSNKKGRDAAAHRKMLQEMRRSL